MEASSSSTSVPVCVFCDKEINDDAGTLQEAGAVNVIKISEDDYDDGIAERIKNMSFPIDIHKECRKKYTKPSTIKAAKKRKLESSSSTDDQGVTSRAKIKAYDPYKDCCLCNEVIPYFKNCSKENPENVDKKIRISRRDRAAEINETTETIMDRAKERNDQWGKEVQYRLTPLLENSDFVALEAKYHQDCKVKSLYFARHSV